MVSEATIFNIVASPMWRHRVTWPTYVTSWRHQSDAQ